MKRTPIANAEAITLSRIGIDVRNRRRPRRPGWGDSTDAWNDWQSYQFHAPAWAVAAYRAGVAVIPHEEIRKAIRSQPTRRRIAALLRLINPRSLPGP